MSGCGSPEPPCDTLNAVQDGTAATCLATDYLPRDDRFVAEEEPWPAAFELAPFRLRNDLAEGADEVRISGQPWGLMWSVPAGDPNAESAVDRIRRRTVRTDSIGPVVRVELGASGQYSVGLAEGRTLVRDASHEPLLEIHAVDAPQEYLGETVPNRFDAVGFSASGSHIALSDWIGTVEMWDLTTGEQLWSQSFDARVRSLALTDDGSRLALGMDNGSLHLADGATGELLTTWALPGQVITTWFADSGRIAARTRGDFSSASDIQDRARAMNETSNLPPGVSGAFGPDLVSLWAIPER